MKSFLFPALILVLIFAGSPLRAGNAHSNMTAPKAIQGDVIPLSSGVPQTGSIPPASQPQACRLGDTQYTIQFPGGAMKLKVVLQTALNVDLYVRRNQPVISQAGVIIADFKAQTPAVIGSGEMLELPQFGSLPLEEGNYFIAIGNCSISGQAIFNLTATFLTPSSEETVALIPEKSEVGSIPAPASGCLLGQTQYTFPALAPLPSCSPVLIYDVVLTSNQNVDLYIRFNQRVTVEDGSIIADFVSQSGTGRESLFLGPVAQDGTLFVAVVNCSTEKADFTVGVVVLHGDPPPPALIRDCQIERSPSGSFSIIIRGINIRQGASVTVGGRIPKKVRFKQPDPSRTFFGKVIVKGRVCSGLPGAIIIRNPGETCFIPFQCNEACSNP